MDSDKNLTLSLEGDYNQSQMSPQMEKQILRRLERIENLLVRIVPIRGELSQNDVLQIIEDGREADKKGETREFDVYIEKKHPDLKMKK